MCACVTQSAGSKQCKYESKYKWLFRIYKQTKVSDHMSIQKVDIVKKENENDN